MFLDKFLAYFFLMIRQSFVRGILRWWFKIKVTSNSYSWVILGLIFSYLPSWLPAIATDLQVFDNNSAMPSHCRSVV